MSESPGLIADLDGRLVLPEVKSLFDRMRARPMPSYPELGVEAARQMVEDSVALQLPPVGTVEVSDIEVDGIPIWLYAPTAAKGLLVYLHGGGWVTGSIAVADAPCRDLAAATGMTVASVDYRRSPEATFPEPLHDAIAAIRSLAALRAGLGLPTDRLVVLGDSAGGNLAALATLQLSDLVTDQVLFYPALRPSPDSSSYAENADDPILSAEGMTWFWSQYLGCGSGDAASPQAIAGLPRTYVMTCGLDVLRDEGRAYAAALTEAGNDVTEIRLDGMIHGFMWMSKAFPQVDAVHKRLAAWLDSARD